MSDSRPNATAAQIKDEVRSKYAAIADAGNAADETAACCGPECCAPAGAQADTAGHYAALGTGVVAEANLGLGCGVPTSRADLRPGEVILDLGSGAGVDVFLAAQAVGPTGRAIGVDMTPAMIERAQRNAVAAGYQNVEFHLGDIEALPVADDSVDVVLSNCVINLAPDKSRVFAEMFRVLRAGGRFTVSDIVTYGEVPDNVRRDIELWTGCIAGAVDREQYLELMRAAGFVDVVVVEQREYTALAGAGYGAQSVTVQGRTPR